MKLLLVDGGDATYLCHWMPESGLADLLPSLPDTVGVGVSAGSMVLTPRIGTSFVEWASAPDDRTLEVVDFSIFPHLDAFPTNTLAHAERWAADLGIPAYAIDEQTAIQVVDGSVEVVSEGRWTRYGPPLSDPDRCQRRVPRVGQRAPAAGRAGRGPVAQGTGVGTRWRRPIRGLPSTAGTPAGGSGRRGGSQQRSRSPRPRRTPGA